MFLVRLATFRCGAAWLLAGVLSTSIAPAAVIISTTGTGSGGTSNYGGNVTTTIGSSGFMNYWSSPRTLVGGTVTNSTFSNLSGGTFTGSTTFSTSTTFAPPTTSFPISNLPVNNFQPSLPVVSPPSGSGGFVKTGVGNISINPPGYSGGTLTLNSGSSYASREYTGVTLTTGGTLNLGGTRTLGGSFSVSGAGTMVVDAAYNSYSAGTVIQLNNDVTIGGVTFNAGTPLTSTALTTLLKSGLTINNLTVISNGVTLTGTITGGSSFGNGVLTITNPTSSNPPSTETTPSPASALAAEATVVAEPLGLNAGPELAGVFSGLILEGLAPRGLITATFTGGKKASVTAFVGAKQYRGFLKLTAASSGKAVLSGSNGSKLSVTFTRETTGLTTALRIAKTDFRVALNGEASSFTPLHGVYDLQLTGDDQAPAGLGIAVLTATPDGRVTLAGRTPDGLAWGSSGIFDANSDLPIFARLSSNKGTVGGYLHIENDGESVNLSGTVVCQTAKGTYSLTLSEIR